MVAVLVSAGALLLLPHASGQPFTAKDPGPRPNPARTIPNPVPGLNANELALFNESLLRVSELEGSCDTCSQQPQNVPPIDPDPKNPFSPLKLVNSAGMGPVFNADQCFICHFQHLRVERADTAFARAYRPGQAIKVCVAHGEGNYFADEETLRRLEGDGRIGFRYCDETGRITPDANRNGSVNAIAGIYSEPLNVLGLMPHPENHVEAAIGSTDGRGFFAGLVETLTRAA